LPFARDSFFTWAVGSLILGGLLGLGFGILAYVFAKRQQRKTTARNWSSQSRGGRLGNGFLILVLRFLGLRAGYFCLNFVYPYFYFFAPKARRALDEYWRIRRPSISWPSRQLMIFRHLRSFARVIMDKVYWNHLGSRACFQVTSDGFECVRQAHANGRGILLIGAHAGNADLAATAFRNHGLGTRIHTLQHEAQRHTIDYIAGEKKRDQVDVIYLSEREPAIHRVHQLLRSGELLGMMADRPLDHNFELVPFFGKLVPIATSPFRIALATGAELVFVCGFKSQGLAYDFFARKPAACSMESLGKNGREFACHHYATEYTRWLETFLDRYPDQWFNLYSFFSRQPALPNGERCFPKAAFFLEDLLPPIEKHPTISERRPCYSFTGP
jgi:predicted LPLAT superfamily acyltransferase